MVDHDHADERGPGAEAGGVDAGDAYIEETRDEDAGNVLVRVRPERWFTVDYAEEQCPL